MPIKTLIIDDTIVYRKLASDVAASLPELEVVGTAANGDIALARMGKMAVDLVFCDVYMPGKSGVETVLAIKERFPDVMVVMMSGVSTRNADVTIKALEAGAIDFIRKPDGSSVEENLLTLKNDMAAVVRLVALRLATRKITGANSAAGSAIPTSPVRIPEKANPLPTSFAACAIGVSTGGPEALNRLIPTLPATLGVPTFLVQHMPAGFTRSLAESLCKKSKIKVVEGEEGMIVESDKIYIAPGGRHMTVLQKNNGVVIALNDGPPENSCRPAVDVLFRSVANVYGDKGVLSLILTGMGSDGCNGVRALKRHRCFSISQAASSCVVYGMPRAIDEAGLSDLSLPLDAIAAEIGKKLKV